MQQIVVHRLGVYIKMTCALRNSPLTYPQNSVPPLIRRIRFDWYLSPKDLILNLLDKPQNSAASPDTRSKR